MFGSDDKAAAKGDQQSQRMTSLVLEVETMQGDLKNPGSVSTMSVMVPASGFDKNKFSGKGGSRAGSVGSGSKSSDSGKTQIQPQGSGKSPFLEQKDSSQSSQAAKNSDSTTNQKNKEGESSGAAEPSGPTETGFAMNGKMAPPPKLPDLEGGQKPAPSLSGGPTPPPPPPSPPVNSGAAPGNLPPKPSATIEPDKSVGSGGGKKKNVYDDIFAKAKNKKNQNTTGEGSGGKGDILNKVPSRKFDNAPAGQGSSSLGANNTIVTKGGSSTWLVVVAVLVVFLTLGAGAYYYFFMYQTGMGVDSDLTQETPEPSDELEQEESMEEPDITKGLKLSEPLSLRITDPSNFEDDLSNFIDNQEAAGADLTEGIFIKVIPGGDQKASTQLMSGLNLELGNLINSLGSDAWIFVSEDSLGRSLNVNLIFSLAAGVTSQDVSAKVKALESQLPREMQSLFIFQGVPPTVPSRVAFQESHLSSGIRFFNYIQGDPTTSVDWGTVSYQGEDLLFFSTSKTSTSMILDKISMDKGAIRGDSGSIYSEEEEQARAASFCKGESLGFLSDKLRACEPMTCNFDHLMTGESMQREIVGMVDGKCQYKEETPGDGELICNYDEDLRSRVADYYWALINADNVSSSSTPDGGSETKIDGKLVDDPLTEAIDNGFCEAKISGF